MATQTTDLSEIADLIQKLSSKDEVIDFLKIIMTKNELEVLSKRWRIIQLLIQGKTQRDISSALGVSLCKITKGAKVLKTEKSFIKKHLL